MRRYELDGYQAFSLAGFPSTSGARDEQMTRITDALGAKPTHELLRSRGAALGSTWQQSSARLDEALRRTR